MPDTSFAYRILIVEDHSAMREAGKRLLESRGYEVHTAADGFEALLALKRSLPDMIISDLSMPNMSGFELLSVVRALSVHSGHCHLRRVHRAYAPGKRALRCLLC